MLRTIQTLRAPHRLSNLSNQLRTAATTTSGKAEGTIADSFASLSGQQFEALEPRFATVKENLIKGNEQAVKASWERLLSTLKNEVKEIKRMGSSIVPQIDFEDIDNPSERFNSEYRKRGVAVIKGAIPEAEALQMKEDLKEYITANPQTKSFSSQVYELYWSKSQIRARGHPNLLKAQQFLLSYWHSKDPNALFSDLPISYCDRLRMREPGDAKFALGPHVDGGSCERWEETGYGKGQVYKDIWQGDWEKYDPWESSSRLPVESDLYQGAGACSAFRAAQGWLSMSHTSAFEGTLLVNPLLQLATAYFLLRPFFTPRTGPSTQVSVNGALEQANTEEYLSPENWKLEDKPSSWLQGANLGRGQELNALLHPHLNLPETMVHIPKVQPGDYVVWHCDGIHAVDKTHAGKSDSSVLYIPACPLTERNAEYLVRQRDCFLRGTPSPDFPGGVGEGQHVGRAFQEDIAAVSGVDGLRAMGLERFDEGAGRTPGEKQVMASANRILGFN
ncbi:DUF1479-domain-containing protein [Aureobasidium pullulans]|uniref:DUF1479-domain-containing protein n=1 Tax=Aureobasidium pullulans TaxID=5580 RepID=A0A4S9TSJ9_AURPU|nr:DUF1479-domain-containing protein [Aureobasidium pullulans]THY10239.1 DUF1479-domain-containing protein [Aureobasidium pullulans]THZ28300.1 DUF1479-domain-containing protein [Aureobasidium pullulans]THZ66593.1 DUF1479-domain-containing protein [Aureobasidium pullulans]